MSSNILILIVVRTYPRRCVPATHDVAATARGKAAGHAAKPRPCGARQSRVMSRGKAAYNLVYYYYYTKVKRIDAAE